MDSRWNELQNVVRQGFNDQVRDVLALGVWRQDLITPWSLIITRGSRAASGKDEPMLLCSTRLTPVRLVQRTKLVSAHRLALSNDSNGDSFVGT